MLNEISTFTIIEDLLFFPVSLITIQEKVVIPIIPLDRGRHIYDGNTGEKHLFVTPRYQRNFVKTTALKMAGNYMGVLFHLH